MAAGGEREHVAVERTLTLSSHPVTYPTVCKFCQSVFIQSDIEIYNARLDRKCQVRNSELNEELGNVDYIFSDKTGTLTANVMVFRKCSIDGVRYGKGTTQVQRNIAMIRGEDIPADETMVEDVPNVSFVDDRLLEVLAGKSGDKKREFSTLRLCEMFFFSFSSLSCLMIE